MATESDKLPRAASSFPDYQAYTRAVHLRGDPAYLKNDQDALLCAALGIAGELSELFAVNADELIEAGDVMSYAVLASSVLGFDVAHWLPEACLDDGGLCWTLYAKETGSYLEEGVAAECWHWSGRFSELVKKHVFQGKELDRAETEKVLSALIRRVAAWCGCAGYSMRQILLANTIKLDSRYPPEPVHGRYPAAGG